MKELEVLRVGLVFVEVIHVELGEKASTWRTKEEILPCLKLVVRISSAKAEGLVMQKEVPLGLQRMMWSLRGSETISQIISMKGETTFFFISSMDIITLLFSQIETRALTLPPTITLHSQQNSSLPFPY